MLALFTRYLFVLLSSIYIFFRISPMPQNRITKKVISIPYFLVVSGIAGLMHKQSVIERISLTFLFLFLYISFITKAKRTISFASSIIVFCLSYVFLIFSCIIHTVILLLIYKSHINVSYDNIDMPIGILQIFLTIFLLQFNRLKNGLSILIKSNSATIGIIFSFVYILYIIIISTSQTSKISVQAYLIVISSVCAFLLLYYWQHRITQTYLERLRIANENSLENEITSLKEEIITLKADNHHLTQIVHKDNKLVPAMEMTVLEFLQSANVLSTKELVTRGNELSRMLQEMARERVGVLTSVSSTNNSMPSSGLIAIDGLLSYMERSATEHNIKYKVKIDNPIKDLILTALREDDLRHLLSDLIENAIIATNHSEFPKQISIHLGSLQDKFLLEISDSGIPFNPNTYQNFGYEHCSTHQEDGGTGTGLLDIWSIKKKYKSSLYIYEYESSSNVFTKKISFLFDGKNHFLLKTYRDKEIKNSLIRGDLHVFPHEAE